MLTWVHFGDLHASDEDAWRSVADFKALMADANRHLVHTVDFAFLPGDNANHGAPDQYDRIREVLEQLDLRWFVIPGDHDFEPGSLRNFYEGLKAELLPARAVINGRRCLFLDIVSQGQGGPDFRLGASQSAWLKSELTLAQQDPERPIVFMHAFPGDLFEDAEGVARSFADEGVIGVDTGHTHYNEILNDGRVIYTATRSTGQVEEGPVGFSLHSVDGSVVSARFKPLDQPWPFVLITSPSDRRLVTDPRQPDQTPRSSFPVRAKVFGKTVDEVTLRVDSGPPAAMVPATHEAGLWTGFVEHVPDGAHAVRVEARGHDGARDADEICVLVSARPPTVQPAAKPQPGRDVHSIGAWAEHGILGTQLGPNKNGRKW
jgi:hypothetical protein